MFDICTAQPLCRILTYDLNFIRSINLSGPIEDPAGVSAAVLWRQVPEAERPLLLTALADLLLRQRRVVLQPHDIRLRISTGEALESHRTAHGTSYDPFSHLSGLGEAGTH